MNKIVKDINEMSVFELEKAIKKLRFAFIIDEGKYRTIIREEKENV